MTGTGPEELDFLEKQPVTGMLLADRIAQSPLSAEEALQYAVEIGACLHKAHSRGMVHGSLSPFSICLADSGAVVLTPPLHPGQNTAPYRSPEQVRGEHPDSRSDVFAFGAILYEMAAGARAFPYDGADLNKSILNDPAPTLTLRSKIYDAMANVIGGCLQKNPATRRQRVQNAVIELRFAAKGSPRSAAPPARIPVPAPPLSVSAPVDQPPAPAREAEPPILPLPPTARKTPFARPAFTKVKPTEPPRAEQFFFRPGEPIVRPRPVTSVEPGWKALFQTEGKLALSGFRMRLVGFIALCLVLVGGVAVGAVLYFRPKTTTPVLRFSVNAPEHTSFPGSPVVSPDGRNLAFSAQGPEGRRTLWLRPLDALRSLPIPGTDGGANPFWSPDGQSLAYFANRSLRIVHLKDNATETVCKVDGVNGGGAWGQDGVILFSRGPDDGIYKVAAKGGSTPFPVLKVNGTKGETGYLWPSFLPDGKHFLFFAQTDSVETTGVYGGTMEPPEYHLLFSSETNAIYSALPASKKNGYLLYIAGRKLMGQGFNAPRMGLAGEPMGIIEDIGPVRSLFLAPISVADNATLVYQSAGKPTRQMAWVDRAGNELAEVREAGEWGPPRISPDGKRAIAARIGPDGENADLALIDSSGGVTSMTTTSSHEGSPAWSPDGSRIVSFVNGKQEGNYDLYVRASEAGSRPDLLFKSGFVKRPSDWSRDGRFIFFDALTEGTKLDVWAVSTADRRAGPILDSVNAEGHATLSPDGKWLAFDSDDTGRLEVYVQAFDGINAVNKRRWKVSTAGGAMAKWRADGKELFFITSSGRVMAAPVRTAGPEFEFDAPVKLFQTRPIPKLWNFFDVTPDGQRFLVNIPLEWANSAQIMVTTNWTERLKD